MGRDRASHASGSARSTPRSTRVGTPPDARARLGTGSGAVARLVAARWPDAEVIGVDVSPRMVAEARRLATSERERYEVADASALPYEDGAFDLVTLNNMIPFFDELARVTAPRRARRDRLQHGPERRRSGCRSSAFATSSQRRSFLHVANFEAGGGVALARPVGRKLSRTGTFAARYTGPDVSFSRGHSLNGPRQD